MPTDRPMPLLLPGVHAAPRSRAKRLLPFVFLSLVVALAPSVAHGQKLYFSELDGQSIWRANRDGSSPENLGATSAPLGIAVDDAAGKRYWIVRTVYGGPVDGIVRSNLDGSGLETLVSGLSRPVGLALDLVHGAVYWTDHDAVLPRIQRANLDGSHLETLVTAGLDDPAGIALDVGAGKMYWVDHHLDHVARANLDGTGIETVVGSGINRPEGIALDVARGKVYWTETYGQRVQRAGLDGGSPEVVVQDSGFLNLVEVKVDVVPGTLFFDDYTAGTIQRCDLAGQGRQVILSSLIGPWGVALDRSPCSLNLSLVQGQWKQLGLPCDPGAASTVAEVFADLGGAQNVDWAVIEWDPVGGDYHQMSPADTMAQGYGYWLKTLLDGQSVTFSGREADTAQRFMVPLDTSTDGTWNMLGHPFDLSVSWSSVRVLHDGQVMTLDQVDPLIGSVRACSENPPDPSCVMSRLAFKWTGSAYQSFDGQTPGAQGVLTHGDGFWVRAYQEATLLVPALPTTGEAESDAEGAGAGEWWVRLIVQADGQVDDGNVLGQLVDAARGYDQHDLAELEPFADDYLTIVFPHPRWGEHAGDYTTDFHPVAPTLRADTWRFEVRSGIPGRQVTLRWDGPREVLARCRLVDLGEPGADRLGPPPAFLRVEPGGSYTLLLKGTRHAFAWVVRGASGG